MEKQEVVKIERTPEGCSITLSTNDLKWLTEQNPDADYRVLDKEKLMDEFVEQLKEKTESSNAVETGITDFQYFIDECIHAVYQNGGESIADEAEQA